MHQIRYKIPISALEELELIQRDGWSFSVQDLLTFVNAAAESFLPDDHLDDGRLRERMSLRTLRHYQTQGCIDPPEKEGREARYRYRQYLQALLIRKLLFEGNSTQQIQRKLSGLTDEGLLELMLERVDVIGENTESSNNKIVKGRVQVERFLEIELEPGMTLRVSDAIAGSSGVPELLQRAIRRIEGLK